MEYIFEEGRCEQAAAGDEDFKAECNMCFKHVQKMSANLKNAAGEYDQNKILPAASMWVACADNFWSPGDILFPVVLFQFYNLCNIISLRRVFRGCGGHDEPHQGVEHGGVPRQAAGDAGVLHAEAVSVLVC